MRNLKPLVFRTDAHTRIGLGHLMRCLALAQVRRDQEGEVHFVLAMDAGDAVERLREEGIFVHQIAAEPGSIDDASQTLQRVHSVGAETLILDGYHFTPAYQKCVKDDTAIRLVVFDDNCEQNYYYADVILNNNLYASHDLYPATCREDNTELLLGPPYNVLRREFRQARLVARPPSPELTLLVTMGGGDPDNVTLRVLRELSELNDRSMAIDVVVAENNPHYAQLIAFCQESPLAIKVFHAVRNMAEVMARADLAISAAGGTGYELIFLNVPFMAVVVAENQVAFAAEADRLGLCVNLGWYSSWQFGSVQEEIRNCIKSASVRAQIRSRQQQLCASSFQTDWLIAL